MDELTEIWTIKVEAGHRFGGASMRMKTEPTKEQILSFCKNVLNNHGSVTVKKSYVFNRLDKKSKQ
jgi:hypothetical protein